MLSGGTTTGHRHACCKRGTMQRSRNIEVGRLTEPLGGHDLERDASAWWEAASAIRHLEPNATGPMHLVSLDRPIHALANRAVEIGGGHRPASVSSVRVVVWYHEALFRLCARVVQAMRAGAIQPRDDVIGGTREVPDEPSLSRWRRVRAAGLEAHNDPGALTHLLKEALSESPDRLFPSVLVELDKFSAWAVSEGLAEPGEVERLVGTRQSLEMSANRPDTGWKETARSYADEQYRKDIACNCNPSKADLARAVATRLRAEGILGPRGFCDASYVLRHALDQWRRPPIDANSSAKPAMPIVHVDVSTH